MNRHSKHRHQGDPVHLPGSLTEQINQDRSVVNKKNRQKQKRKHEDEEEDEQIIDDRLSRKIIEQAREQQNEFDNDELLAISKQDVDLESVERINKIKKNRTEDSDEEDLNAEEDNYDDEEVSIDEEDEKALEAFMSDQPRRLLGDIIAEKQAQNKSAADNDLDPRISSMYEQVGEILARYRSGKIPKAFKILPNLANWEQVLLITQPDRWTAASMYQATRLFASNMDAKMAQRFYNIILLPRIRDDIDEYKKLNFQLYMALRKALFKPSAFFKGIILPLCESGTCTLREAVIIASILAKNSVPMLHSAAALLKIAEMNYSGGNSIFIRTLIEKRYALPFRVVDALVHHFIRFRTDTRELPVLWHQSLLSFVQNYRQDISTEQKQALLELLHHQFHHTIGPEIRKLLSEYKCRDEEDEQYAIMDEAD
jgi:essential nuclear protein 1